MESNPIPGSRTRTQRTVTFTPKTVAMSESPRRSGGVPSFPASKPPSYDIPQTNAAAPPAQPYTAEMYARAAPGYTGYPAGMMPNTFSGNASHGAAAAARDPPPPYGFHPAAAPPTTPHTPPANAWRAPAPAMHGPPPPMPPPPLSPQQQQQQQQQQHFMSHLPHTAGHQWSGVRPVLIPGNLLGHQVPQPPSRPGEWSLAGQGYAGRQPGGHPTYRVGSRAPVVEPLQATEERPHVRSWWRSLTGGSHHLPLTKVQRPRSVMPRKAWGFFATLARRVRGLSGGRRRNDAEGFEEEEVGVSLHAQKRTARPQERTSQNRSSSDLGSLLVSPRATGAMNGRSNSAAHESGAREKEPLTKRMANACDDIFRKKFRGSPGTPQARPTPRREESPPQPSPIPPPSLVQSNWSGHQRDLAELAKLAPTTWKTGEAPPARPAPTRTSPKTVALQGEGNSSLLDILGDHYGSPTQPSAPRRTASPDRQAPTNSLTDLPSPMRSGSSAATLASAKGSIDADMDNVLADGGRNMGLSDSLYGFA